MSPSPSTEPRRAADPIVRAQADIAVHCRTNAAGDVVFCRFVAKQRDGVRVDSDGTIHIEPIVGPRGKVPLVFHLVDETGQDLFFHGIQLGVTERTCLERPLMLDTSEEYYRDEHGHELPFRIANPYGVEPVTRIILTQFGLLEPPTINPFFYRIVVGNKGGARFVHDPKIYNEGNGDPPDLG